MNRAKLAITAFVLIFAALFVHASAVFAYASPGKPAGFVNDFAAILPPADRAALEAKLSAFEKETGAEIVVATVPSLGGDAIEDFAVRLFQEWGIGKKKTDNGLLLLVAPNEREARIEVGYGLEPTVTDAAASAIIRNVMIPAFKDGDYAGGIGRAADIAMGLVTNDPSALEFVRDDADRARSVGYAPIIWLVILIILLSTRFGRRMLFYMFLSGAFRGGRGGRDGGGFGGFGGGRSGGGGASGRW
ncbi:TPM domain-containing protein [Candidatus Parcubacteria bacterium]|nr:TPM domain-containing protein [Candidatus Parcubacteria bacterium]